MMSRQGLRRLSVAIDPGIAFVRRRIGRVGESGPARAQQAGTGRQTAYAPWFGYCLLSKHGLSAAKHGKQGRRNDRKFGHVTCSS